MAVGADLENLDADAIARSIGGCRRGRLRGRRRSRQRPGPKAHRRLRRRGEADRGGEDERDLALPDGERDGVRDPAARGEQMRPYYEAKLEADEALAASGLDYTIVRPGPAHRRPGHRPDRGRRRAGAERRDPPRRRRRDARSPASTPRHDRQVVRPARRRDADRGGDRRALDADWRAGQGVPLSREHGRDRLSARARAERLGRRRARPPRDPGPRPDVDRDDDPDRHRRVVPRPDSSGG